VLDPPPPPGAGGGGYGSFLHCSTFAPTLSSTFSKKFFVFFVRFFLTLVEVVKRKRPGIVQVHAKKSEKKCTKDVDDSAGLGYLLCMVTITLFQFNLNRAGFLRWITREIAGVAVQIAVERNEFDDYVLDICGGFDHSTIPNDKRETIRAEILAALNNDKDNILASFGY
jgi:hypothetical protein